MLKIFKEKISPYLAILLIIAWGYFCINWMEGVFDDFAKSEILLSKYDQISSVFQE